MTLYHQIERHSSLNPRSLMHSRPFSSFRAPTMPHFLVGVVRSGLKKQWKYTVLLTVLNLLVPAFSDSLLEVDAQVLQA